MRFKTCLFIAAFAVSSPTLAKTVKYELTATRGEVNLSGRKTVDFALMINGSIPAPTLEFTEGDEAEIVVKNNIPDEELSIHWHGILLPPEMDGVAYVTTPPIFSGQSYTFKFKIRQHGTYWYHSHTDIQEQKGLYGALVFHPKKETIKYDKEAVVVLSDWSDENATNILKNLRKDGDYYLYKKDTVRSYLGAIQAGGLGTYLDNEWTRMGGMDLSDVGYDAFLINGKKDSQLLVAHPGERIRLRIVNAGASSYFYVSLGKYPMRVISADGMDTQPVLAKEILLGMAETYDVLFTVPEHKNYELRATAQDGTGQASTWIGMGEKVSAPDRPAPDLYASMDHGGHGEHGAQGSPGAHKMEGMDHSAHSAHEGHQMKADPPAEQSAHENHQGHDVKPSKKEKVEALPSIETLGVDDLKSPQATAFPKNSPVHDVKLVLGGDMERYVWHINGKAMHEDRNIIIKEGDVVRFTLQNETMMHHPMHLHGHFFRVLNKNGDHSPLKHTVDVPPHGTRTIEFLANEPGEWMLHCHNLYHMKTGMARVVKYSSFTPKPEIAQHQKHDHHMHDHWYFYGNAELATNHAQAYFRMSQTWSQWEARIESRNTSSNAFSFDEKWENEGELFYRRWFGQYLSLFGGGMLFEGDPSAAVGVGYLLPLLIEAELIVNHRGKFRLGLEKRFQWTKTILTDAELKWRPNQSDEQPLEYKVSLMYKPAWSWAAGLVLTDVSLGAGLQVQF